jgi:hypothetical protein
MMPSRIKISIAKSSAIRSTIQALTITFSMAWLSGCGSSTTTTAVDGKSTATSGVIASSYNVSDATNVVAQFLDAIRRGGETNGANQLLTQHAQAVLQRLGRTVQPIGSPDAVFTVTRAEAVPDTPGAALVHSLWTEPSGEGKTESYQVVWAMEHEGTSWRISGLAMDLPEQKEPIIVDFENAGQMANLLNSNEESIATSPSGVDAVSQAPPAPATVQR